MPIYEFECLDCGIEFEKLMRRAEAASNVACPVCNSRRIEEKISTFASHTGSSSNTCAPAGG